MSRYSDKEGGMDSDDKYLFKLAIIILGYLKGVGYDISEEIISDGDLRKVAKEMTDDFKTHK
jgi:hypothetical protein